MSLTGFGANEEPVQKGKAIFKTVDVNNMKATLYRSDNPPVDPGARATGRKAAPGAGHLAESPFGTYEEVGNSPNMKRKNNKWDAGAAKVGSGGFNAELTKRNYEASTAASAAMKARNQHGAGNFLSFDAGGEQ